MIFDGYRSMTAMFSPARPRRPRRRRRVTEGARVFELRRLRLLHELAQRGTIAAVAQALAYSPSTISQQLSQLEREAGVALLAPDGRRVRLTAHGETLAAYAARALDADEEIRGELEDTRLGIAPVRLAVLQTAARALVPAALTLLAERTPGLRVEIELPPEEGLFELGARGFDLAIAEQYRAHSPAPIGARSGSARRRSDPAGDGARIGPLADLAEHAWVMEPRGTAARVGDAAVPRRRVRAGRPLRARRPQRACRADRRRSRRRTAARSAVGRRCAPVHLSALPGDPAREIFTAARRSSRSRPGIRSVREALADAFVARRV
jgi:DNA-binding transcriptional LysR family regulator